MLYVGSPHMVVEGLETQEAGRDLLTMVLTHATSPSFTYFPRLGRGRRRRLGQHADAPPLDALRPLLAGRRALALPDAGALARGVVVLLRLCATARRLSRCGIRVSPAASLAFRARFLSGHAQRAGRWRTLSRVFVSIFCAVQVTPSCPGVRRILLMELGHRAKSGEKNHAQTKAPSGVVNKRLQR